MGEENNKFTCIRQWFQSFSSQSESLWSKSKFKSELLNHFSSSFFNQNFSLALRYCNNLTFCFKSQITIRKMHRLVWSHHKTNSNRKHISSWNHNVAVYRNFWLNKFLVWNFIAGFTTYCSDWEIFIFHSSDYKSQKNSSSSNPHKLLFVYLIFSGKTFVKGTRRYCNKIENFSLNIHFTS